MKKITLLICLLLYSFLNSSGVLAGGKEGGGGGFQQIWGAVEKQTKSQEIKAKYLRLHELEYDIKNKNFNLTRVLPSGFNLDQMRDVINKSEAKLISNPDWQNSTPPYYLAYAYPKDTTIELDESKFFEELSKIDNLTIRRITQKALGFHEILRLLEIDDDDYNVSQRYYKALHDYYSGLDCKRVYELLLYDFLNIGNKCYVNSGVLIERIEKNGMLGWLNHKTNVVWYDNTPEAVNLNYNQANVYCLKQKLRLPTLKEAYDSFEGNFFQEALYLTFQLNFKLNLSLTYDPRFWTSTPFVRSKKQLRLILGSPANEMNEDHFDGRSVLFNHHSFDNNIMTIRLHNEVFPSPRITHAKFSKGLIGRPVEYTAFCIGD